MKDIKDTQNSVETYLKYLTYRGWKVDTCFDAEGFKFKVSHENGSSISNSFDALVLLYETLQKNEEKIKEPISDEELLKNKGYYMICESPLVLGAVYDDSVEIKGFTAHLFLDNLRQKHRAQKS